MRYILLFLLLIIFQSNYAAPDSLNYLVKHYTTDNGLPQNSVKSIGSDSLGFIWMTTEAGLVRYDGQTFKWIDPKKIGLKATRMRFLQQSPRYNAMIAFSEHNEVAIISKGKVHSSEKKTIEIPSKYAIERTGFATGLPIDPIGKVENYLIEDEYKNQFVITNESVNFYSASHHLIFRKIFKHSDFLQFFLLENKLFYLDKKGLLNNFDRAEGNLTASFQGDILKKPVDLLHLKLYWSLASGQVFAYANKRLYFLTLLPNGNINTRLLLNNLDVASNQIICIFYEPSTKRIYLGSHTKGLYIFEPKYFSSFIAGEKLYQTLFYAQLPYGKNRILSSQGYIFDPNGKTSFRSLIAERTRERYTLLRDEEGHIWTTADSSIYEFDEMGMRLLTEVKSTTTISRLSGGLDPSIIWLGGYKGSLQQYNKKSKRLEAVYNLQKEITWLEHSTDGRLWIGTVQGLYSLNPSTEKIDSIKGSEDLYIRSLYIDEEKNIWICTDQKGFFLYKKNKLYKMPLDRDGYLSAAHCILEDSLQNFWISTNNGLFQIPKQELLDFSNTRTPPVFTYYNKDKGFQSNEFNGGCEPCGIKLSNGDFAFPSIRGIIRFNPLKVKAASLSNEMIVDEVDIDGRYLPIRDTLTLNPEFSQLKITIGTPYFGHPNNLHIEYKLTSTGNFSSNWLPLINGKIILSKLSSGIHRIDIRKISSADGRFKTIRVLLYIPSLFYETWWFITGLIILLTAITWLAFKLRVNHLKNKNLLLTQTVDQQTVTLQEQITALQHTQKQLERQTHLHKRLSASISHDVKTPLRFIVLTLKKIHEQLLKEQHPIAGTLEDVQIASNDIHDYTLMLTDYSKFLLFGNEVPPRLIKLRSLVDEKIRLFRQIAEQKGVHIKNEVPDNAQLVNHHELLSIVFHNLIDNAIKFTLEGTIHIKSIQIGSRLKLTIEDSGMGMSNTQVDKINAYNRQNENNFSHEISSQGLGLKIAKDLVVIMQGWMRISSIPKKGTIVTIELPSEISL